MISTRLLPLLSVSALAVAACGGSDGSPGGDSSEPAEVNEATDSGGDRAGLVAATTSEGVCDALDADVVLGALAGGNGSLRPQSGVVACAVSGQVADGSPVTVIVEVPRDGEGDGSFEAVEAYRAALIEEPMSVADVGDEAIVYTDGSRTKLLAGVDDGSIGISSDITLTADELADVARVVLG